MASYLARRGGVWWARLVVPERLRPAVGRREFVQSCRTADLHMAKTVAAMLISDWRQSLMQVYAKEGAWAGLVNPKLSLQTLKIEKFASVKMRNSYRADDVLNLHQLQQAQMAAIRGKNMQEKFKALGAMVSGPSGTKTASQFKQIDRAIVAWCSSQLRFERHYDKYRAYAMACELLENPTIPQIALLAGYIMGTKPLSESSARQTLSKLVRLVSATHAH